MKRKDKEISLHRKRLEEELGNVQDEMAAAMDNFRETTEPELIDYYSYHYKASEAKYSYLLRQIKTLYYK